MQRKRLVADRFRRIWRIAEDIARSPGRSRRELAERFSLSERQVQSDLAVIRVRMRLPLVRHQGYRFASPQGELENVLSLEEATLLLEALRRTARERPAASLALVRLGGKLTRVFPPHLQPLIGQTLAALPGSGDRRHEVIAALATALVQGHQVRLHYPAREAVESVREPVVKPELLIPYLDTWYLIGRCKQRARVMMFDLSNVAAVSVPSDL